MTRLQTYTHQAHHNLKLGKAPATEDERDFKFSAFLDTTVMPQVPITYGFDSVFPPNAYGMLGNDDYGCCVWSGAGHETMVLGSKGAGATIFTDQEILAAYSQCTGFDIRNPQNTDLGTNVRDAMKFRANQGIVDTIGREHKIGAYLKIDISKDLTEFFQALFIFETVGIGINFPQSAMDQFNANQPWSVVRGSPIEGGHYVPVFSKQGSNSVKLVSWARMFKTTQDFLRTYMDEAFCYISADALKSGKTIRGFDVAALTDYMNGLK